jgi:hypothetical protein
MAMAMANQNYCQNLLLQIDITRKWEISSFGLEKRLHLTTASMGHQHMEDQHSRNDVVPL